MKIDLFILEDKNFKPVKQIELPFVPATGNIYLDSDGKTSYKIADIIFTDIKIAAVIEVLDNIYTELHHTLI
jgi:hypothetical protein